MYVSIVQLAIDTILYCLYVLLNDQVVLKGYIYVLMLI
jgi:hypothetical protein